MLKRNIEVRQNLSFGHKRNNVVNRRVRINVMQPHPGAKITQSPREFQKPGFDGLAAHKPRAVARVKPVSGRILADHEKLFDAAFHKIFGFPQNVSDRAAHKVTS